MEVMEMVSGNSGDEEASSRSGGGVDGGDDRMDVIGNRYNYWTNQRHLDFLSSMEASFVTNLMHTHSSIYAAAAASAHHRRRRLFHRHLINRIENLRLDRFVPDISESTLDLQTTKNNSTTSEDSKVMRRSGTGRSRRQRERPNHPYKISPDQVVPQAEENGSCDVISIRMRVRDNNKK